MSTEGQEKFEKSFQAAISASLQGVKAGDDLRARLARRLQEEKGSPAPEGVSEPELSEFEHRLTRAVAATSEWAPENEVVLRTELKLSEELQRDVLSERAVHAILEGEEGGRVSPHKLRYVEKFRHSVQQSVAQVKAPERVRRSVLEALRAERGSESSEATPLQEAPKVVALDKARESRVKAQGSVWSGRWKKAAGWGMSMAAGFAFLFLGLFGGADAAVASGVQVDHQHCAKKAEKGPGPNQSFSELVQKRFGEVPEPQVDGSWTLEATNVCPRKDDYLPMVHYLYSREKDGKKETLSLHFIPPAADSQGMKVTAPEKVKELSGDEFPVLAWEQGYWVCTACSPDLSLAQIDEAVTNVEL